MGTWKRVVCVALGTVITIVSYKAMAQGVTIVVSGLLDVDL